MSNSSAAGKAPNRADRDAVLKELTARLWEKFTQPNFRPDEGWHERFDVAVRAAWDAALEHAIEFYRAHQGYTLDGFAAALRQQKTNGGKG